MANKLEYKVSSGNVFKDIGLPNSQERFAKAQLASKIIDIAQKRHLTQKKIASFLGVDQPKVSSLFRGHLSNFSIARLIKFLILLEQDIEITVKDRSNNYEPFGHLKVILNDFHTKENFNNTQKHS
jgi:predicted XRE-type DNA-binding protein